MVNYQNGLTKPLLIFESEAQLKGFSYLDCLESMVGG